MNESVTITIEPHAVKQLSELLNKTQMSAEQLLGLVIPKMINCVNEFDGGADVAAIRAMGAVIQEGHNKRRRNDQTEIRVNITADGYGILAAASIVLGCSIQKAFDLYVNQSQGLCDWQNDGFPL
jgi:hypothetical protein